MKRKASEMSSVNNTPVAASDSASDKEQLESLDDADASSCKKLKVAAPAIIELRVNGTHVKCQRKAIMNKYTYFETMLANFREAHESVVEITIPTLNLPITPSTLKGFLETGEVGSYDPERIWLAYQFGKYFGDSELEAQALVSLRAALERSRSLLAFEYKMHYLADTCVKTFTTNFLQSSLREEIKKKFGRSVAEDDDDAAEDEDPVYDAEKENKNKEAADKLVNEEDFVNMQHFLQRLKSLTPTTTSTTTAARVTDDDLLCCMLRVGSCWLPSIECVAAVHNATGVAQQQKTNGVMYKRAGGVEYEVGQSVVAPPAEVSRRFAEWTGGLFEGYGSVPFPWQSVVIAGGFVVNLLQAKLPPARSLRGMDIDVWVYGCDRFESEPNKMKTWPLLDYLVGWCWFHKRKLYMHRDKCSKCILSLRIEGVQLPLQVLCTTQRSPYAIVNRFDMSHLEWAYKAGHVYGTASAVEAFATRCSEFKPRRSIACYERIAKSLRRGFDVHLAEPELVTCWGWKYFENAKIDLSQFDHKEMQPAYPSQAALDACVLAKGDVNDKDYDDKRPVWECEKPVDLARDGGGDVDVEEEKVDGNSDDDREQVTDPAQLYATPLRGASFGHAGYSMLPAFVDYRFGQVEFFNQYMQRQAHKQTPRSVNLVTPPLLCFRSESSSPQKLCVDLAHEYTAGIPLLREFVSFLTRMTADISGMSSSAINQRRRRYMTCPIMPHSEELRKCPKRGVFVAQLAVNVGIFVKHKAWTRMINEVRPLLTHADHANNRVNWLEPRVHEKMALEPCFVKAKCGHAWLKLTDPTLASLSQRYFRQDNYGIPLRDFTIVSKMDGKAVSSSSSNKGKKTSTSSISVDTWAICLAVNSPERLFLKNLAAKVAELRSLEKTEHPFFAGVLHSATFVASKQYHFEVGDVCSGWLRLHNLGSAIVPDERGKCPHNYKTQDWVIEVEQTTSAMSTTEEDD